MNSKQSFVGAAIVYLALASGMASAAVVLDLNFNQLAGGGVPTNGQALNTSTDFFPSNVFDGSGNTYTDQAFTGSGTYMTYAVGIGPTAIPEAPNPLPPNWDASAVRGNSRNWNRYPGAPGFPNNANLAFPGSFSAFTRIYREGANSRDLIFNHIMGGAQSFNFGWSIHAVGPANEPDAPFNLDVWLGGDFGVNNSSDGVYLGNGPLLENNTWYDIGIVYAGTPFDGIDDTLKVFLNGQLIDTFIGDADFDASPLGLNFSYGADTFSNQGFAGLYDRIILWNEAVADSVITDLSAPSGLPGDFDGDTRVDGNDFLVWQRELGATLNAGDLATWRNNFGAGGASAATLAIPEPGVATLLAGVVAAAAMIPRTRRLSPDAASSV